MHDLLIVIGVRISILIETNMMIRFPCTNLKPLGTKAMLRLLGPSDILAKYQYNEIIKLSR